MRIDLFKGRCRTPEEFAKGHFGGAINVPVSFEKDGVKTGNPDFTKEASFSFKWDFFCHRHRQINP